MIPSLDLYPGIMSIHALWERLAEAPMVKLAPLFAVGILLADVVVLPTLGVLLFAVLCALASLLFQRGYAVAGMLIAAGYLSAALQQQPTPLPMRQEIPMELELTNDGLQRGDYLRFEAELVRWQHPETKQTNVARGRLWLYVDTLQQFRGGDRLQLTTKIYPFRSDSTFYADWMIERGYLGRCYHQPYEPIDVRPAKHLSLHLRAIRRMRTLFPDNSDATAVVRAMTVADRDGLTPALRAAYSRSGTAHLLAVSGLHTAMLFLVVNLLLWWLPILHRGHRLQNLLAIVAVWLFVAAAGFPASAVRAAVMCTMLQLARFSSSLYRALNGWAAAAMLLLLVRPSWLFDLGFQLSFLAVGAILVWGIPLTYYCRTRYRIVNWVVDALLISIVATLGTTPLAAHHFGLIPWAGVFINPLAILLGTVVVALGIILLLVPPLISLLGPVILQVAQWQNQLVEMCAKWELGAVEYCPSKQLVWLIYLIFLVGVLVAGCRDRKKTIHVLNKNDLKMNLSRLQR